MNSRRFPRGLFVWMIKTLISWLPYEQKESLKRRLRLIWQAVLDRCVWLLSPKQRRAYKEFNDFVRLLNDKRKQYYMVESSMPWFHALFQRPQQLCLALGELGHPVIYKYPYLNGPTKASDNVWVADNNRRRIDSNRVRILLSTYRYPENICRPDSPEDILVYDYIDQIDEKISGSGCAALIAQKEKMFAEADIVTASAKILFDEAAAMAKGRVVSLPNGVDTRHYFSFSRRGAPPPPLAGFCSRYPKIVGYFGALAPWLDYGLINALINARKDLGFVFIGPGYCGRHSLDELIKADNLLLTGTVDYAILPEYASWFDVCWIPFEPGDIAKTTSPLKLFEYFALGKPVVATSDLRECAAFPQVLPGHDVSSFSQSFDKAFLLAKDPAAIEELKRLAVANSWLERARVLSSAVQEVAETKPGRRQI